MWEDSKTGMKWLKATKCYFPDDLPGNIGHPCISEVNEVTIILLFYFICTSLYKIKVPLKWIPIHSHKCENLSLVSKQSVFP